VRCLLTAVSDASGGANFSAVSIVIPSIVYLAAFRSIWVHACHMYVCSKHSVMRASPTQIPCSLHLYDYLAAPTDKLNFYLMLVMIA
jgi:hypothetical protein